MEKRPLKEGFPMKAFEIRSPGDYGVTEAPEPVIGEEEVLVQVAYAAICHSDIDMLTGARRHLIRYPNIGGHEFAGTVVRAGHRVKGFRPGDRVACECIIRCGQWTGCDLGWNDCENYSELGFMQGGGFAEYCAVPARNCHRIADHVSFEQAASHLSMSRTATLQSRRGGTRGIGRLSRRSGRA